MEEMPIRRGDWADEECVGALLSVSFTDDPFVRWLLPRSQDFLRDSKKHPRRAYSAAFDAGTVFVVGDCVAAAVSIPPERRLTDPKNLHRRTPRTQKMARPFRPNFRN